MQWCRLRVARPISGRSAAESPARRQTEPPSSPDVDDERRLGGTLLHRSTRAQAESANS
jgi:hypothetical protein